MKLPTGLKPIWLGFFIVACLALASCGKKVTPQQARQSRLDWNLKTSVVAYRLSGDTDAAWDEPAEQALNEFARSRSGMLDSNENWSEIIGTNCAAAIKAGCDDPMIQYLYVRNFMSQTNSPKGFAEAFCKMADEMEESSYSDLRKFYASLRAAEQLKYAADGNSHYPPEVNQYRRQAITNLADTLEDKTVPIGEVDDACHEMFRIAEANKKQYEDCYNLIEGSLFKNWPDASAVWLIKGEAYIKKAWFARGGDYADKVTDEGWRLFKEHLDTAEASLNRAWKLNPKDPRIAVMMMRVELGQGQGRDRMELWFQRAMELDPNDYDACNWKLFYIEPKWYGSRDAMLDFGRECVRSTNWGGEVPLILAAAHWQYTAYLNGAEEKSNYWKAPDVWPDIKAAYDRFYELNPGTTWYYQNYAWYAYHAEQWETLNEIIPKLGPVNYAFFGGKDEFDKMIQFANEHAGQPATTPEK
jgi:hypothetical protein